MAQSPGKPRQRHVRWTPSQGDPEVLPPCCPAQVKVKAAQKFLGKGHRVKLTLQFRGREMEFQQIGREMFQVRPVVCRWGAFCLVG